MGKFDKHFVKIKKYYYELIEFFFRDIKIIKLNLSKKHMKILFKNSNHQCRFQKFYNVISNRWYMIFKIKEINYIQKQIKKDKKLHKFFNKYNRKYIKEKVI